LISGIMELAGNCEIIFGLQSVAGKILETQHLAARFFTFGFCFQAAVPE